MAFVNEPSPVLFPGDPGNVFWLFSLCGLFRSRGQRTSVLTRRLAPRSGRAAAPHGAGSPFKQHSGGHMNFRSFYFCGKRFLPFRVSERERALITYAFIFVLIGTIAGSPPPLSLRVAGGRQAASQSLRSLSYSMGCPAEKKQPHGPPSAGMLELKKSTSKSIVDL